LPPDPIPDLECWKCGASLAGFPLPLSRLTECPKCRAYQHVCRLCVHYAPGRPRACTEQDAEEVNDKEHANFCGWFEPRAKAHAGQGRLSGATRAALDGLFGADLRSPDGAADSPRETLDNLFRPKPK